VKRFVQRYIAPALASVVVSALISLAFWAPANEFLAFYAGLMTDTKYLLVALMVPPIVVFVVMSEDFMKQLGWRWINFSPFDHGFVAMPVGYRYLWLPFALLLAYCIPLMAWMEEVFFRFQVNSWIPGLLWGSVLFGLLHLLALVPLRVVLYLCALGAILVEIYFSYGLAAAFVFHTTYNFIVLVLILVTARIGVNRERSLIALVRNGLARR